MADKGRRKSSILKVTKTTPRAPLQDVNNLDVKSSQEDDVTSHTAVLRRRVSFRGKNFVKEFCAEADIASVLHAPEYEQEWHASTDSSGLVTSDNSNNTHSNTAISESHSAIHSITQFSELKCASTQDEIDPSDEIMREFMGVKASKSNQPRNPSRKTRFSFGEINIPCEEGKDEFCTEGHRSDSGPLKTNTQTSQASLTSSSVLQSQSHITIESSKTSHVTTSCKQDPNAGVISSREVHHSESVKVTTTEVKIHPGDSQRLVPQNVQNTAKFPSSSICTVYQEIGSGSCTQLTDPENSMGTIDPQVFLQSPVEICTPTVTNNTVFDNSGMELTAPVPGIIKCGNQLLPDNSNLLSGMFSKNNHIPDFKEGEAEECEKGMNFGGAVNEPSMPKSALSVDAKSDHPADSTICLNDSMEFTKAIPGIIQLQLQAPQMTRKSDSPPRPILETECIAITDTVNQACSERKSNRMNCVFPDEGTFQEINQCPNIQSHRKVQVTSRHEDLSEDLPRNAYGDSNRKENYQEVCQTEKNCSLSQTVMMNSSMEFTEVLPVKIQVINENLHSETGANIQPYCKVQVTGRHEDLGEDLPRNAYGDINRKENYQEVCQTEKNCSLSQTVMMNSSMEFTEVLPVKIQVMNENLHSETGGSIKLSDPVPLSQNVVMCTSKNSRNVLAESQHDLEELEKTFKHNNDVSHSETQLISISMELTKALPGSIEIEFEDNPYEHEEVKQPSENASHSQTQEMCTSMPANIQLVEVPERDICPSLSRGYQETHKKGSVSPSNRIQDLNLPTEDGQHMDCNDTDKSKKIECVGLQRLTQDSESCSSGEPCLVNATDPASTCESKHLNANMALKRNSISVDPFIARPRLISSPMAKNTIQDHTAAELVVPKSTLGRGSTNLNSCEIESMGVFHSQDVVSPNPFASKPCLPRSPPETDEEQSKPSLNESFPGAKSRDENGESVCILSSQDNGFTGPNASPHMIVDELPPFEEFSVHNTTEMSSNLSESNENMLHTTIRNAEISLRQLQSSGETEDFDRKSASVENMECDPLSNDKCALKVSDAQSSLLPINVQNQPSICDVDSTNKRSTCSSYPINCTQSSKRVRDESSDGEESNSVKIRNQKSAKRSFERSWDSRDNEVSNSSISSTNSMLHSVSTDLCLDDLISEAQSKQPQIWVASKCEDSFWLFKFRHMDLDLKVNLQLSLVSKGKIEASEGHLSFNVTMSTNPVKLWGLRILKSKLSTVSWNSDVNHSADFMQILQKITSEVVLVRRFIVETIIQQGVHNITITESNLSFKVGSLKSHLLFEVTFLKLQSWENYCPEDVIIKNIVGDIRAVEVKNLITCVDKDVYFLRNYIRDIYDYVKMLEGFCK